MDKYEYKVRADEIKELIAQGEYVAAAELADGIDWRRVKSVMMLCTISDLYKINRRYEDARDMLLLAYERRPGGRTICYSLCELSIKMEEYVQAVEYYKEFVQVAPKDPGRYILQYKLYEAQDVSLEERIEVLEELKKHDYREKWAYELAYLYHRVGLSTRCVEECDEMILWFGEGKYVIKAMELKMLHQPLTPQQQEKYDQRFNSQVPQKPQENSTVAQSDEESAQNESASFGDTQIYDPVPAVTEMEQTEPEPAPSDEAEEEMDIHVKTMDVGQYNTINLQAELAEGLREVLGEDGREKINSSITRSIVAPMLESDTESLDYPQIEEVDENDLEPEIEQMEGSEVFFGETGEIGAIASERELSASQPTMQEMYVPEELERKLSEQETTVSDETAEIVMKQMRMVESGAMPDTLWNTEPPKEMAEVLSQESDGQISLVVPDSENVEKQITGQMSIEDILAEWERMKRENEEKRKEEVRRNVLQQTGSLFTEFEMSVRDGLLEKLEKEEQEIAEGDEAETIEDAESIENTEEIEETQEVEDIEDIEETQEAEEIEDIEETQEAEEIEDIEETQEAEDIEDIEETQEAEEIEDIEETQEAEDIEGIEEVQEVEENKEIQETESIEDVEEVQDTEEIAWDVDEASVDEEQPALQEQAAVERDKAPVRGLTKEERELYAQFVPNRSAREQLVQAIDSVSLAAYTGNVIVTGEEGMDTITLAKNMVREIQTTDSNFSGKVAKIRGEAFNKKDVAQIIHDLENGALIIEKASEMNQKTADALNKSLQQENWGVIVVLEDTKRAINRFLESNKELAGCFTARMDLQALSNDTLVAYGKQYAKEREYSIDELGVLALHTRIEDLQTSDHAVTVMEVKEILDQAIRHANRKTIGHFMDVLLAKRYDDEDMIILGEKDFA